MAEDRSIHPRYWPEIRMVYKTPEKQNTCKARGDKQKAINGLRDHCARHPNDKQSETHLAWLEKPAA